MHPVHFPEPHTTAQMSSYDESTCMNALNRIFGYRPAAAQALVGHFGSASALFSRHGIADEIPFVKEASRISDEEYMKSIREMDWLRQEGISFIHIRSSSYPPALKECPDAPVGLYIRSGTPPEELFGGGWCVSVVGTRDLSPYGMDWCTRIVEGIAGCDSPPPIVSGLAIGTDITAHRTALRCGLPTIAVMATGADSVYPWRHRREAERMSATPGCALVTDFPPHTPPIRANFLRRNRIIAGLSTSTILTESRARGGGMLTARLAFSYGRNVFALPGRADDIMSEGCNMLIREQTAEPVVSIDGLLDSLRLRRSARVFRKAEAGLYCSSAHAEKVEALSAILLAIRQNRGISLESLAEATGMDYASVQGYAGMLEADGLIVIDIMRRCSIRKEYTPL